ncbi:MAG TPA: hypothetical protein VIV60_13165 [Polyangiaceae bacterium]
MRWHLTYSVFVCGLGACTGGQSGTDGEPSLDRCSQFSRRYVDLGEVTALGSAQEVFDSLIEPETTTMRWYSHSTTDESSSASLTMGLTGTPGEASHVDPLDAACVAELQVEAHLRFTTSDGSFDEMYSGHAYRTASGQRGFRGSLVASGHAGSYDASTVLSTYTDPYYNITTSLRPASGHVVLVGRTARANATSALIAEWPAFNATGKQ